jgi:excisionase family DNA binding protein
MTLVADRPLAEESSSARPSPQEQQLADKAARYLAFALDNHQEIRLQTPDAPDSSVGIPLPEAAARLLGRVLAELAEGNAVTLVPVPEELTTQQAADLLNVSRPFLVGLLDTGQISSRKVGKHRRVLRADLLAYKASVYSARRAVLDELTAEAQELGLGY